MSSSEASTSTFISSRILFPSEPSNNSSSTSHKAPYRPGKIPGSKQSINLKRNDSIISLPSPPSELRLQSSLILQSELNKDSNQMELDEDEEMEEMEDDDDDRKGIRSQHITNPFLLLASRGNERDERNLARVPDHPNASPTQLAKRNRNRRIDRDRILFGPQIIAGGEKIEEEEEEEEEQGVRLKDGMGLNWNDPNNPFLAKEGDGKDWKKGQAKRPEKMTYVFRGKRITYDIPLSTFLSADDPTESPFPMPSPRLLFPATPITPPSNVNPSSSFLDALRGSNSLVSPVKRMREEDQIDHGLPTPAREGRKKIGSEGRFSPFKRA